MSPDLQEELVQLRGRVVSLDGATVVESQGDSEPASAQALGERIADELLTGGADAILAAVYGDAR